MADSRSSFMNTIRQNLEETIQSQYLSDVKPTTFAKAKSSHPPSQPHKLDDSEDFPPDFEDFGDE